MAGEAECNQPYVNFLTDLEIIDIIYRDCHGSLMDGETRNDRAE